MTKKDELEKQLDEAKAALASAMFTRMQCGSDTFLRGLSGAMGSYWKGQIDGLEKRLQDLALEETRSHK